jgi:hypothetical protein
MTRSEKIIAVFRSCRGPFPYRDFERLLVVLGYALVKSGGGSSRKFFNEARDDMIMLHEPHDGVMQPGMVKRLQDHLDARGLL